MAVNDIFADPYASGYRCAFNQIMMLLRTLGDPEESIGPDAFPALMQAARRRAFQAVDVVMAPDSDPHYRMVALGELIDVLFAFVGDGDQPTVPYILDPNDGAEAGKGDEFDIE